MKKYDPAFELPRGFPSPPEENSCSIWRIYQNQHRNEMKIDLNESNPNYDTMLTSLRELTFCENDCKFCTSVTNNQISSDPYFETCVGPEQMRMVHGFPENTCKKYSKKEIQKIFGIGINPLFESMIPTTRGEDKMEELCACSKDGCRANPSTAVKPSTQGLKCDVGFNNDFEKFMKTFNPDFPLPKEIPIPPRVMYCADWYEIQDNKRKETIRFLETHGDFLNQIQQ